MEGHALPRARQGVRFPPSLVKSQCRKGKTWPESQTRGGGARRLHLLLVRHHFVRERLRFLALPSRDWLFGPSFFFGVINEKLRALKQSLFGVFLAPQFPSINTWFYATTFFFQHSALNLLFSGTLQLNDLSLPKFFLCQLWRLIIFEPEEWCYC